MASTKVPTKAEIEAENEALRLEIEALKKAHSEAVAAGTVKKVHPATPPEEGMVEEVVYRSDYRSPIVNFPFREGQGPTKVGGRAPVAEFQPLGDKGFFKAQDPEEIKYLDWFSTQYAHCNVFSRDWVFPNGVQPVSGLVDLPSDLAEAIEKGTRAKVNPNEEGEPV